MPGEEPLVGRNVEIGAKGVKATVLEVTLDKQGRPTRVNKPRLNKTANTSLAVVEKDQTANGVKFKEAAIQETAEDDAHSFTVSGPVTSMSSTSGGVWNASTS